MSKKVEKFVKQIFLNLLRKMSIYDIIYSDNKKLSEVIFIGGRKMTPEAKAREVIDRKLEEVGYVIQDMSEFNPAESLGVAVREFPTNSGPVDYLLFINRMPVGVIEAKRTDPETGSFTEYLADYLISNGVTVSPCEIDFDERLIRNFLLLKIEEAERSLKENKRDEN